MPADVGRALVRGSVVRVASTVVQMAIGFLMMPFMISSLGDHQYGLYVAAGGFVANFYLLDLGFSTAVMRNIAVGFGSGDFALVNRTITHGARDLLRPGCGCTGADGRRRSQCAFLRGGPERCEGCGSRRGARGAEPEPGLPVQGVRRNPAGQSPIRPDGAHPDGRRLGVGSRDRAVAELGLRDHCRLRHRIPGGTGDERRVLPELPAPVSPDARTGVSLPRGGRQGTGFLQCVGLPDSTGEPSSLPCRFARDRVSVLRCGGDAVLRGGAAPGVRRHRCSTRRRTWRHQSSRRCTPRATESGCVRQSCSCSG